MWSHLSIIMVTLFVKDISVPLGKVSRLNKHVSMALMQGAKYGLSKVWKLTPKFADSSKAELHA